MKTAFTLIEILIVVILLGVLAAIVVPQFGSSTDAARASTCKSKGKDIVTAVSEYKLKESTTPTDIAALVSKGYLPVAPKCGDTTFTSLIGECPLTGDAKHDR